jgi:exonuclease III
MVKGKSRIDYWLIDKTMGNQVKTPTIIENHVTTKDHFAT